MTDALWLRLLLSLTVLASVFLLVRFGFGDHGPLPRWWLRSRARYDGVLNRQLLLDIDPGVALASTLGLVGIVFVAVTLLLESPLAGLLVAALAAFVPSVIIHHLAQKRRERLEQQLVDGLVTLASGVRAGLTLVQSMELMVRNHRGPLQQEIGQVLREYELGSDLHRAMRQAGERIGSPLYRLTFTAIEMHRVRGGDSAESMDRIAESVREIHRLEGKLDALTAQGRAQANFMGVMAVVLLVSVSVIFRSEMARVLTDPAGRLSLLIAAVLIVAGFVWIRRIMDIDL